MKNKADLLSFVASKKAVLFDLYHTLTATEITTPDELPTAAILGVDRKRWNELLMESSRDRLTGVICDPYLIIKTLAHSLNPLLSEELIDKATIHRKLRFRKSLELMPEESVSTVRKLKESGKKVALISNADFMEIEGWNTCPAAPYFDEVIFSCEAGYMKPDQEIYRMCLERLGEEAGDCVFVGDGGSNEFAGAKSLGIATIMVTGIAKNIWPEKLPKIALNADYVIERVTELVKD